MTIPLPPVITLDGPTASGKGTVAQGVARVLGWHVLDSGALYRLTALAVLRCGVGEEDVAAIARAAEQLDVCFDAGAILLAGAGSKKDAREDVTEAIRSESVGNLASRIAAHAPVRAALLARQRAFQQPPGLVADGRDMGSVVFPEATLKIFLVSDVTVRAKRRHKQLIDKGISATFAGLLADLTARDARDASRAAAPLVAAADAITLDSSHLTVAQTIDRVLALWRDRSGTPSQSQ